MQKSFPGNKEPRHYLEFVYDFYRSMKSHEINIAYEGEVTHQILKAFTSLIESTMEKEEEAVRIQRTVFHVMVESLQNISRHADDYEQMADVHKGKGVFIVSKNPGSYFITSGNFILKKRIQELRNMLDRINEMDPMSLKELFKRQIKHGILSDKGGAGLGFIDIRRKTGKKLIYHFLPVDEHISFFLLTSTIGRTKN